MTALGRAQALRHRRCAGWRVWLGVLLGAWLGMQSCLARQPAAELRAPFYVAERDGRQIYLLGTFHVGRSDWYPLRRAITDALQASTALMTETGVVDAAQLMEIVLRQAMCDPPCLTASISERTRTLLERYAQRHGFKLEQFERMRPWWAAIFIDGRRMREIGYDARYGVDLILTGLAADKPQRALGSAEKLMALMSAMGRDAADEFLYDTLRDSNDTLRNDTEALARRWCDGDAEALYAAQLAKLQRDKLPHYSAFFLGELLDARNRIFMTALDDQLRAFQGPLFVAVGALHLGGPQGLLALLRERGWQVEAR